MAVKESGEIVRYEPAPEPLAGAVAIAILSVLNVLFILLFVVGLLLDPKTPILGPLSVGNSPVAQQFLGFCLASSLTTTAFILAIYRRWFLPDMLVVKKRRSKFEDL